MLPHHSRLCEWLPNTNVQIRKKIGVKIIPAVCPCEETLPIEKTSLGDSFSSTTRSTHRHKLAITARHSVQVWIFGPSLGGQPFFFFFFLFHWFPYLAGKNQLSPKPICFLGPLASRNLVCDLPWKEPKKKKPTT